MDSIKILVNFTKIKLVFVIERMGPYHLARMMALVKGFHVIVIELVQKDEEYQWSEIDKNNEIEYYTLFKNIKDFNLNYGIIKEKVQFILEKEKPLVVFISGYNSIWTLIILKITNHLKIKNCLMTESHQEDFKRYYIKENIKSYILNSFDTAMVGGTKAKQYIENIGFKPSCIEMYYDIVDNLYFHDKCTDIRQNKRYLKHEFRLPSYYILASSRFIKRKNIDTLINVFAKLIEDEKFNKVNLVILGEGEERNNIERLIESMKLSNRVLLPGFIQYESLPVYYSFAEFFIHISLKEQWGLVVNEAMASSLPVIVSKESGCAIDLVKNDYNGFIVSATDKEEILSALQYLIVNFEKRNQFSSNSLERINATWSPSNFYNSIISLTSKTESNKKISVKSKMILNLLIVFHSINMKFKNIFKS